MKVLLHAFNLKIKERFKIAHTTRDSQEALVVELQDVIGEHQAVSGLGETTANPYYHVDLRAMQQEVESLRTTIETYRISDTVVESSSPGSPEHFWQTLVSSSNQSSVYPLRFRYCSARLVRQEDRATLIPTLGTQPGQGSRV